MPVFTVHYTYDPSPEQRAQRELYNPAHRGYLRELMSDGIVLAAGRYANDERPGALLIFRGTPQRTSPRGCGSIRTSSTGW